METHEAPQSLWNLIVEHVPESELPEIRGFLGDALIDMYTEMLAEVIILNTRRDIGHRNHSVFFFYRRCNN